MASNDRRTVIVDLDGCVLKKFMRGPSQHHTFRLLPHAKEQLRQAVDDGDVVILMTGRKESLRPFLQKWLGDEEVSYDHLIMGVGGGVRVLVNDDHPETGEARAVAVRVVANQPWELP